MKPHKHAELIKAWADGAEIEMWINADHCTPGFWLQVDEPTWGRESLYRIKQENKKISRWLYAWKCNKKEWVSCSSFFSEKEADHYFNDREVSEYTKLEWSRTEFPE